MKGGRILNRSCQSALNKRVGAIGTESIAFMTEEATVFRRVAFGEWHVFRVVAFDTEFSRRLFIHAKESVMIVVVWDFCCGFFRGIHEEGDKCDGGDDKSNIDNK